MDRRAIEVLLGVNQAELSSITRQNAELTRKWDRLQLERAQLLGQLEEVEREASG